MGLALMGTQQTLKQSKITLSTSKKRTFLVKPNIFDYISGERMTNIIRQTFWRSVQRDETTQITQSHMGPSSIHTGCNWRGRYFARANAKNYGHKTSALQAALLELCSKRKTAKRYLWEYLGPASCWWRWWCWVALSSPSHRKATAKNHL